ncbi:MAG: hypothetical protein OEX02_02905 [Cyclobacteriaceae bacterium]|nr:hypothetical protein [Cyclobacteriaceae bacterium]
MFTQLLESNKKLYFIFLCLATFLLLMAKKSFIEYETAAFMVLEQKGEMGVMHAVSALQFVSIPFVYLYKFTLIAFLLWIGSFMFGYKITYSSIFGLVIISETIFLLPEFLKLLWFMFVETDPNIHDIRSFYPLSLINLFDYTQIQPRYHYPLKALNVFEVIYWFMLAQAIHYHAEKRKNIAWAIVFSGYVFFFLGWLGFYITVYK